MLVLGLAWNINGAAIHSGSQDISMDVAIPRGYTQEEYSRSIIDYWTPERMAEAKPLHPTIATKTIEPFVSNDDEDGVERILTPSASLQGARNNANPPAAGRAFFTMNKLNYVCSGSVVNAANRDTVVTAGHCVFNSTGKEFATNWVFVPQYDSGNRPHGTFTSRRLATKQLWKDKADYNHDVAIVLLNKDENGQHVQDITGAFGISLNAVKKATTNAFGFPMNINNGETMSTCADTSVAASILLLSSFKGLQIKCGMGGGASGGPWLQNYDANTKGGQQVSLTSFSHAFAPGKINGPHFIEDNIGSLYREHQNQ